MPGERCSGWSQGGETRAACKWLRWKRMEAAKIGDQEGQDVLRTVNGTDEASRRVPPALGSFCCFAKVAFSATRRMMGLTSYSYIPKRGICPCPPERGSAITLFAVISHSSSITSPISLLERLWIVFIEFTSFKFTSMAGADIRNSYRLLKARGSESVFSRRIS